MVALRTLAELRESGQPATPAQQATIARYGSWGAVPEVFDQRRADWHERRVDQKMATRDTDHDTEKPTEQLITEGPPASAPASTPTRQHASTSARQRRRETTSDHGHSR